jgi:hypothetical protein
VTTQTPCADNLVALINASPLEWAREVGSGYFHATGDRFEYWLDECPPLFSLFYQRRFYINDQQKHIVKESAQEILNAIKYLERQTYEQ